ncbi:phosphate uptake regulator PhoU [Candidatus Woesearchaeota archaeon]|jgi:phosphate uptake regulator|nr:phosphate uptake regulator PhoU [Candidatus Woesearchaeota archaeon]MBT3537396.1 phosphate uptake regulator PhoU [Candidatus Woesearchaeota archaeon]MBT4697079.1 phosphate uptake regulator PhoU [Candidatus Woesearchaeota archaeon]MBT4716936.1 phosphate uptake regulator PhoU [Candidatus Woesearchaeota archaeon]MBT7106294.1 phosphate uptake regulator PhoU [Candidatus Woesearchaeota archaeon]
MKRRVVEQGGLTLMVSLPRKWAKKHNLKKGDEIDLKEEEEKIVIYAEEKESPVMKATLNITDLRPMTFNYCLLGLYVKGVDEIEVRSDDLDKLNKLDFPVNQLIGYEIVSQNQSSVLIKDVSTLAEGEFDIMLRRSFLIITQMAEGLLELMKNKECNTSRIEQMDLSVNKFMFLCMRIVHKLGCSEESKSKVLFYTLLTLEQLSDNLDDLAQYIRENKVLFHKKAIDLFGIITDLLNQYQKLFYKFDLLKSADVENSYRELKTDFDKYMDKIEDKKQLRCLMYMHTIADQIVELIRNQRITEL